MNVWNTTKQYMTFGMISCISQIEKSLETRLFFLSSNRYGLFPLLYMTLNLQIDGTVVPAWDESACFRSQKWFHTLAILGLEIFLPFQVHKSRQTAFNSVTDKEYVLVKTGLPKLLRGCIDAVDCHLNFLSKFNSKNKRGDTREQ